MDAISAVTFDLVAQHAATGPAAAGKVSVYDVARFEALHQQAGKTQAAQPAAGNDGADGFRAVLRTLQTLNGKVEIMGGEAMQFAADKQELTPGDMLQMTVRCHQFMFHCELTANVANRTSEGVQQLFRQQS